MLDEASGEWSLAVETTEDRTLCESCGVRAIGHGRCQVVVGDLPLADRPVVLVWAKRLWRCAEPACATRTWSEESEEIAPRAVLTERARAEIARGVGPAEHSVAQAARDFGGLWHAAMAAVRDLGRSRVDHLARLGAPSAVGLDETSLLAGTAQHPTMLVTGIVDLDEGRLVDVLPARRAIAVTDWLTAKPAPWLAGIRNVVIDPYQPYATAVAAGLPDACLVVDHFHVIRLANAAPDEVRRRVQQTTTGHRGRKDDPLYRIRRLPASHDRLRYGPSAARVPTGGTGGEAMSRRTPGVFQDPTGAWRLCSRARVAARTANGVRCGVAGFSVARVWRSGLAVL